MLQVSGLVSVCCNTARNVVFSAKLVLHSGRGRFPDRALATPWTCFMVSRVYTGTYWCLVGNKGNLYGVILGLNWDKVASFPANLQ